VVAAFDLHDETADPKTGARHVPIPPQLVAMLQAWVDEHGFTGDDVIFRSRNGLRPTPSNWLRAWQRALANIGHPPLRIYDLRHAAATTWLAAGVPMGGVAQRLGHSVEVLVSTYVGALHGDDITANRQIDAILVPASEGHVSNNIVNGTGVHSSAQNAFSKP
jgi:integrase